MSYTYDTKDRASIRLGVHLMRGGVLTRGKDVLYDSLARLQPALLTSPLGYISKDASSNCLSETHVSSFVDIIKHNAGVGFLAR